MKPELTTELKTRLEEIFFDIAEKQFDQDNLENCNGFDDEYLWQKAYEVAFEKAKDFDNFDNEYGLLFDFRDNLGELPNLETWKSICLKHLQQTYQL